MQLDFSNKEEIIVFRDFINYAKWELKIDSMFTGNPFGVYRYYFMLHCDWEFNVPFIDPKYKWLKRERLQRAPNYGTPKKMWAKPGENYNHAIIGYLNDLLVELDLLIENPYKYRYSPEYHAVKFSIDRLIGHLVTYKYLFRTFLKVIKA
jgi:hypothetical protein